MNSTPERRTVLLASGGALLLALALLLTAILPAEYGWDPLGTGAALDLLGLAGGETSSLIEQPEVWRDDRIEFKLAPFEAVEYKYRLAADATILFQWSADSEVLYDMHAEPDGAAPGYAQSFSKKRDISSGGSYTAPFAGIHGWYWQNRGQQDVTVTLQTSGFYREAVEMRDGHEFQYEINTRRHGAAQP
jgi:hypothetical protein